MTISITEMIAGLEAKIAAADSNITTSELLNLLNTAEELGGGHILYDSAAFLPTDSAHIGTIRRVSGTGHVKAYNGTEWIFLDSAAPASSYVFQGSISGYTSGGTPSLSDVSKTIQKFSFTSDGNSTDVGDLTRRIANPGQGASSSTDGYTLSGGNPSAVATVDKFPFATDANAATTNNNIAITSASYTSSETAGYQVAGVNPYPGSFGTQISKYVFANDTSTADAGDTATIYFNSFACNSGSVMYAYGGANSSYTTIDAIEKYPFSAEGTMTDVGNLTTARRFGGRAGQGQNSSTHGYAAGGTVWPGPGSLLNVIDKFPFAADANATDVGDMTITGFERLGTSSTASGYASGGDTGPADTNVIEKFSFSTDGNATDVGDLDHAFRSAVTQQN